MDIQKRIEDLRGIMEKRNIDTSIIFNFENQYYFSGLKAITYSRPIILIIEKETQSLIIPKLEENHAKEKTNVSKFYIYHEVESEKNNTTDYVASFREAIGKLEKGSTIGIEFNSMPTALTFELQTADFKLENISQNIVNLRNIKSKEEIELIKESGRLVSNALKHSLENSKYGITEMKLDYYGNQYLFEEISESYAGSTLDYFVMSPSGLSRTNMPHVFSNTKKLEEQDIIIHSRQVGLNGYRAECERTFFIGQPTNKQKEVFEVMLKAHHAALDFIKVGVKAKEVNEAALKVIRDAGLEDYVAHRTGHGIGIGLHEEPYLRFDNDLVLEAGMVFCVEPGIYIPDVGGFRHSDTVVLKEDGTEIITEYPRDLDSLIFDK